MCKSAKAFLLFQAFIHMFGIILCFASTPHAIADTSSTQLSRATISVTLSYESAFIGKEIIAHYALSGGSGEYPRISGCWNIVDNATNCTYQKGSVNLSESSGEVSFIPSFGDSLYFQIEGEDSNGIPFLAFSDKIDVFAVPTVFKRILHIPSSTQIIETEAFRGIPIDIVYIPESVITIAADAFDPSVLLVPENPSAIE